MVVLLVGVKPEALEQNAATNLAQLRTRLEGGLGQYAVSLRIPWV